MAKRYTKYDVEFEKKYFPGTDREPFETPVEVISMTLFAENIESAAKLAWQTVTVNPTDYDMMFIGEHGYVPGRR